MKRYYLFFLFSAITIFVKAQTDTIKVCYMGSSSFPDELAEYAKIIAEASGDFYVELERQGGYFRHDNFAKDSLLYVDWMDGHIQGIADGHFDVVIMQAFNYQILSPAEHDFLFEWVLPDMVGRIKATGADVMFYHKFGGYGCYPNPPYANHFFEVEACVHSGVTMNTLAAGTAWEIEEIPYFMNIDFLVDGGGHPGPMEHYMTACAMSYMLTGVDPRGNTARSFPVSQPTIDSWLKFDETDPRKEKIVDGNMVLTDWEADTLQRMTMRWHLPWSQKLHDCLADNGEFQLLLDTIFLLEADYANYREWSDYDQGLIDKLDVYCDQSYVGVLSSDHVKALRDTAKIWSDRIQAAVELYFSAEETELLRQDYLNYWNENNVKFRDDVYFKSLMSLAIARAEGYTDEIARLEDENKMFLEVLSQPAENFILQRLSPADRATFLSTYNWNSPLSDYSPNYGAIQMDSIGNWQQMIIMREIYFKIWEDVNLEDELRDNDFPQSVWLKADSIFVVRWNALLNLNATGTYLLIVNNGTGGGYFNNGQRTAVYSDLPELGLHFKSWTGNADILNNPLASATILTMPETNACISATYKKALSVVGSNFSFETPDIAEYEYAPAGSSWSWSVKAGNDGGGISDNAGTPWTDNEIVAPDGEQLCYLKGCSWIRQDIDFPDDVFQLSIKAAQRVPYQDATQTFEVKINSRIVGTFTPTTNDIFLNYITDTFSTSGIQTLTIEGTNPEGGINAVLIDDIQIKSVVPVEKEPPSVPVNLISSNITYKSFTLSWDPATDNVGILTYEIYKDNEKIAETPDPSFEVTGLSASTIYSMTVKAKDAAQNVSAYSSALNVTTSPTTGLYKLTVYNGSGDGDYEENEIVSISANTIVGKAFDEWTGDVANIDDVNAASTTITMSAAATTVTATYVDLTYTVTFIITDGTNPIQDAAVTFNSITINTNASGEAIFNNVVHSSGLTYSISKLGYNSSNGLINATANVTKNITLSVAATPTYIVTINSGTGSGNYEEGVTVNISANTPPSGQVFDQWTGDISLLTSATAPNTSFTMPAIAVNLTANYKNLPPATYTATITNGAGSGNFAEGETINISADAAPTGKEFDQWTGDISLLSSVTASVTSFTMPANAVNLTATYKDLPPLTYSATVTNGTGSGSYEEGEIVNITAGTAPTGQEFDQWTGDISLLSSVTASVTSFTMPANGVNLTATYKNITSTNYTVTIENGTGSGSYTEDETVTITADAALSGHKFSHWAGDNQYLDDTTTATSILTVPSVDVTLTAVYTEISNDISENEFKVLIYPNPANSMISIKSDLSFSKVEIIDNSGKTLFLKNSNSDYVELDIHQLSPGQYFVRLYCENELLQMPLIKN